MTRDTSVAGPSTPRMREKQSVDLAFPTRPASAVTRNHTQSIDARYDVLRHYRQSVPREHLSASLSSTRTIDSIDLEKGVLGVEMETASSGHKSHRSHKMHRNHRDQSKRAETVKRERIGSDMSATGPGYGRSSDRMAEVDEDTCEVKLEDKAMKILSFLAGPLAAVSIAFSVWTLGCLLFTLLLAPLRLCICSRPSLRDQLLSRLVPRLNFQFECVYSSIDESCNYSVPVLILILLISPILALAIAVSSWIVAIYWLLATIVGNPDGLDGRNDGREFVLGLRRWWEEWLTKAIVD